MIGFVVLAVLMVVGALGVVLLRQPIHAALSLVATLLALAVTYLTLQAHFIGIVQVIVYAGAIMVLFLFVLMLLNVGRVVGQQRSLPWLRPTAYGVGGLLAVALMAVVWLQALPLLQQPAAPSALVGSGIEGVAEVLFGDMLLAFHLVGVLLLTGVVAAVALVQRRASSAHGAPKASPAGAPKASAGAQAAAPLPTRLPGEAGGPS